MRNFGIDNVMAGIDRVLRYWWVIPVALVSCRIGGIVMLKLGIREGVDYCIAYQPLPRIMCVASLLFWGICVITLLLSIFRKKWKICLALLATFLVCLFGMVYEIIHDPWGWW